MRNTVYVAKTEQEREKAWKIVIQTSPGIVFQIPDFDQYSKKVFQNAVVCYSTSYEDVTGAIAFYCNNIEEKIAYITQISVLPAFQNNGIGTMLIAACEEISAQCGMTTIKLEVADSNHNAQQFYKKLGFKFEKRASKYSQYMMKCIEDKTK